MAIDLTPEQKETGRANFHRAVGQLGLTRRDFMKGLAAAGATLPVAAAVYFGYNLDRLDGKPVRTALIGSGDEGGVLIGEHNPKSLEFVAYCDIRPSNQKRIFEDERARNPDSPRKGFKFHYGSEAPKKIKLYDDYKKLLEDPSIEAVVIALPLHLHAPVAIDCMKAGKHVLCEKLMAWNISQCKEMIEVAQKTDRVLSIGHQRHYSMLYAHAVEVLQTGVLGDIKHIRALWHRNNTWPQLDADKKEIAGTIRDSWRPVIKPEDEKALKASIRQLGYKNIEELVRWRLYHRTGGGLMAELGSHQLDACSIFLTAMAKKNYPMAGPDFKLQPLAVTGVGGKYFYHDDRDAEDHVFVTFEFPGPNYYADHSCTAVKDKNDIVVVTYSSINTNAFEPYGECLMGTRGSMVVEMEQNVMLYPERGGRSMAVSVGSAGGGQAALESAGSGPAVVRAQDTGMMSMGKRPVSRGYTEEMDHFAYCIRMRDQGSSKDDRPQPRCHGKVAMADAIIALTSNQAMKKRQRIEFSPTWFDPASKDVPDADMKPEIVAG